MFKVRALPPVLLGALVCAAPAMAHPEGDFTGLDYVKGAGWGLLGGAGGLLGGALAGTALGDHDVVGWGAGLGYTLGSAWAVYAYGENSGHRGRFLPTVGLGAAGLVAGGLFLFVPDDFDLIGWGIPAVFVLPLVGAVAGYALSVDDRRPTGSAPMPLSVPLLGGRF